jgi:hypothetical protein
MEGIFYSWIGRCGDDGGGSVARVGCCGTHIVRTRVGTSGGDGIERSSGSKGGIINRMNVRRSSVEGVTKETPTTMNFMFDSERNLAGLSSMIKSKFMGLNTTFGTATFSFSISFQ